MFVRLWFAIWCSAAVALGSAANPDPFSNLRPDNITGLIYYLYRWTGSYYNGTTVIRIDPQDFMDDEECDTFTDGPVEVSYDSLFSIFKSSRGSRSPNQVNFALRYWDKSLNLTPSHNNWDGPINDITDIESVDLNRYDQPAGRPSWNLNSTYVSGSSYSFSGYRNDSLDPSFSLRFNYSQCSTSILGEYAASVIDPPFKSVTSNLQVTDFTTVSGRFDNNSASLEIKGTIRAASSRNVKGNPSYLAGPVTITFLGTLDGNRSDNLLPNKNGTPIWESTLGYSKTMYGTKNAGGRGALDMRVYAVCLFGAFLWLL
ncbi:uncharacterized protein BP5553_00246 [Venustampulla echinocandica]|uniref:Uncharacterized protein n=1 Tax=Venustampulla echinocandica TaxID=2656787 RepID=A0A370TXK6_9HELO|nr:uncharacterized protein BP5553_00246 [Venustampulla echinocandica]RDL40267.1 hypothetical protein BP5553_00246 [Venustampulla echinocandica]